MRVSVIAVVLCLLAHSINCQTYYSGPGNRAEWILSNGVVQEAILDQTFTDAFDGVLSTSLNGMNYSPDHLSQLTPKLVKGDEMTDSTTYNFYGEWYFPANEPTLRYTTYLENLGLTSAQFSISFANNLGSDSNTVIEATSSGDTTVDTSDFWFITSDGGQSDPYLTWNFFANAAGVAVPVVQSFSYSDSFTVQFDFTLAGYDAVSLTVFVSLAATLEEALLNVNVYGDIDAMLETDLLAQLPPPAPSNYESPGATCQMNIQVTTGSFNSEVSWDIYEYSTLIASGGATADQNFTIVDTSLHRIEMFDSFGDGWNLSDYYITRTSDGVLQAEGTLLDGYVGVRVLELECEGDAPINPLIRQGVGLGSICNFFNGYKNLLASEHIQKRHLFNEPWFC